MKKSHRKDVIIARIIFAAIVLVFIALIVTLGIFLAKRHQEKVAQNSKNTETESETIYIPELIEPESEKVNSEAPTQEAESGYVWATANVNLRAEASTSSEVLAVLNIGDELIKIGEQDGFIKVNFNGVEGYVYQDYVTDENPNSEPESESTDNSESTDDSDSNSSN